MKKIILTSLIAACASLGLSSCMNGDYDANPATTAGGTNPLTPPSTGGGSGGSTPGVAQRAEIRFRLNGTNYTLQNGKYIDGNPRIMSGGLTTSSGERQVGFIIDNYTGPATYIINATDNDARYTLTDFNAGINMKNYLTSEPGGGGEIIVTSDANEEMVGTFKFTAFNSGEKVELTDGSFRLPKQ